MSHRFVRRMSPPFPGVQPPAPHEPIGFNTRTCAHTMDSYSWQWSRNGRRRQSPLNAHIEISVGLRAIACWHRLRRVLSLPHVRQELVQIIWRCARQLGQDAGEVTLRVDAVAFATGDEGPELCVVGCGIVVAGEEPVLSA